MRGGHADVGDEMVGSPYLFAAGGRIGEIGVPDLGTVQPGLFPKRVSTRYPLQPQGADIAFVCDVAEGGTYYCKKDSPGRVVRLTDWLCTNLARHLGIATAECAVVEDDSGSTFFGSLAHRSTALNFSAADFLQRPQRGELGQPSEWPGRYLSQLYVLDLFLHNPDRDFPNFVLQREGQTLRICAIDFAASDLALLTSREFPIAQSRTVRVGKLLRRIHDFFPDSSLEMIDRIAAVPATVIAGFLEGIPADWGSPAVREGICEDWQRGEMQARLSALRAGIRDGSLL